jgi:hypothetical protein
VVPRLLSVPAADHQDRRCGATCAQQTHRTRSALSPSWQTPRTQRTDLFDPDTLKTELNTLETALMKTFLIEVAVTGYNYLDDASLCLPDWSIRHFVLPFYADPRTIVIVPVAHAGGGPMADGRGPASQPSRLAGRAEQHSSSTAGPAAAPGPVPLLPAR